MAKYVTVEKLAGEVGLSRQAIWNLKKKGQIKEGVHFVKRGRRMFMHRENFDRWLEGSEV